MVLSLPFIVAVVAESACAAGPAAAWEFDSAESAGAWVPNSFIANVTCEAGVLQADGQGRDPFFTCTGLSIPARPWHCVVLRMKASADGEGQLYWTSQTSGTYGGFSPRKVTNFKVVGDGAWHEIPLLPFWHAEGTIRQLRLDVYDGAHFEIDWIRILEWGDGDTPQTDTFAWDIGDDPAAWQVHPGVPERFAPPLRLDVSERPWVTVRLQSDRDAVGAVRWADPKSHGVKGAPIAIKAGPEPRFYNIHLKGARGWGGTIVAFGLRLPSAEDASVRVASVSIAQNPSGPPDLRVTRFGFQNALNRIGRDCEVAARVTNLGGMKSSGLRAELALPDGLELAAGQAEQAVHDIESGASQELTWTVRAAGPGPHAAALRFEGAHAPAAAEALLKFAPRLDIQPAGYVPEPQPVATELDVLAYYFPGWESDTKWDCIRTVAPERKPLLGYYDEANPECVDWQIKWAAENGISCFLVDWYWCAGVQRLRQWFEGYRKSRYRKHLEVAIMWANHNPPGTHSIEDWRSVTREWIDHYFNLDTYYTIDGKPAVFLWAPSNIRRDLGGTEAVRAAFDESREMARAAGYDGITFVAMGGFSSADAAETLAHEGYVGGTTYHEWGDAPKRSPIPQRARYSDVAETARLSWQRQEDCAGGLMYYPVVDTGWDSRPWHGQQAFVIEHRTADDFERILREAKAFCEANGKQALVLGPLNEWGEGSYIEPCAEFGFDMYERIRAVLAAGAPSTWPVNVAPEDVGRGPYDFPPGETRTKWSFQNSPGGWVPMMAVPQLTCEGGALHFTTKSADSALLVKTPGLVAEEFARLVVRMQVKGAVPEGDAGQLFWERPGRPMSEEASVRFALVTDGEAHEYSVELAGNKEWHGPINTLRFDPCNAADVEVFVDEIRFEE
ncbi:MAG: glycoside hydrolase family 99-like domain-containing protein [Candidatus Hydrogenedentes bacterium]|nr:glycoside hydrolase family 99-like domain-containing protein [Candidatus Hydrogenedentota bacterium]